jgi:alpha-glucosidase (family GH31 glycosyl hydrolase)
MSTGKVALRAYKKPLRFAMYKADNTTLVWEETKGLTYGKETVQYLKRATNEYFYGGGMQNGRFSHRDKTILMRIDWNWEDGGAPNPAPFFMSTNGYGALRNTYAPGEYAFTDTLKLQHTEARFDCYYFAGESLKDILNAYTDITGKPFLPPRWALGMGDANCYNRGATKGKNTTGYNGTTPDVIPLIADKYIENDIPRGWILPNDGYGCGYTKLDSVVKELSKRGFHTGLWTENGVEKIAREVGEYGSRLCKLDVAWIGEGYKFGIDGCKAAYDGIEQNSDARGFIWSVCGWAGSHRNTVMWTGDQKGTWDYIRWHIPTVIGSGLSAQNCATGDIDGIFGGSDSTFTRDLQWKTFTPVLMSMTVDCIWSRV